MKLDYSFGRGHAAEVSVNGAEAVTATYTALKLGRVVMLSHMMPGSQTSFHVVWDQKTDLATVFEVWFSDPNFADAREAQREVYFGYVAREGKAAPEARHAYTSRFENKGIVWTDDRGEKLLICGVAMMAGAVMCVCLRKRYRGRRVTGG